jgi:hypothetical protein
LMAFYAGQIGDGEPHARRPDRSQRPR